MEVKNIDEGLIYARLWQGPQGIGLYVSRATEASKYHKYSCGEDLGTCQPLSPVWIEQFDLTPAQFRAWLDMNECNMGMFIRRYQIPSECEQDIRKKLS